MLMQLQFIFSAIKIVFVIIYIPFKQLVITIYRCGRMYLKIILAYCFVLLIVAHNRRYIYTCIINILQ